MGEKQFFFSYTVILLQAAYSFHRKGHSYDSRLGIWVKTYQIPHNFLITWPAIRRPATGGTKETLPGMERFEEERDSFPRGAVQWTYDMAVTEHGRKNLMFDPCEPGIRPYLFRLLDYKRNPLPSASEN